MFISGYLPTDMMNALIQFSKNTNYNTWYIRLILLHKQSMSIVNLKEVKFDYFFELVCNKASSLSLGLLTLSIAFSGQSPKNAS